MGCFRCPCMQYGQTPLHLVDNHAAKEAVQLLLKHGAEVDARDEVRVARYR